MTKQEQIEEMTKLINSKEIYPCEDDVHCENCFCSHKDTAEKLYNAGYRKAEEVRKETAKEIISAIKTMIINRRADERSGLNLIYTTYSPERLFDDISEYVRITVGVEAQK